MSQTTAFFPLGGGLDLVTPALSLNPGRAVAALNYEPVLAGYRRVGGYERFDGRASPSAARIAAVHFVAGNPLTGAIVAGDTVYQQTDGSPVSASGFALAAPILVSGAYGDTSATGYILIVPNYGDFVDAMPLLKGGAALGTQAGPLDETPGLGAYDRTALLAYGRDLLRWSIQAVPGSGPVRGIWFNNGRAYAVRDSEDGSHGALFYSVLNDAAQVSRLLVGGERLTIGGFTIRVTVGADGWITAPGGDVLPAGGRYSFITHNFYGGVATRYIYGANGVGQGFEYDGTAINFITTGTTPDTPTRIAEYKQALFLAFRGGSVQFSQPGEPLSYDGTLGAGEIGVGDEIADFLPMQDALGLLAETSVNVLYGNDKDDFQKAQLSDEAGALPWTAQRIGSAVYLDNRGLRDLKATSSYGNFSVGNLSMMIEPLLADLRRDAVAPTASLIVRSRSQYWLFLADGTAIVFLFGKKQVEALPVNLGVVVTCAASVEDKGVERVFIGCTNGFVYELDRGVSFDGEPITYYMRLAFNYFGSPQVLKRAHKVTVDMEAGSDTTLSVSVDVDLGAQVGTVPQQLSITTGGGALIDGLGDNELYFASQIETVAEAYLGVVGKNFSLKVAGESATEEAHTLTGVTYHISPRGLRR